MFGEEYDEVVDAMTSDDKIKLKEKLLNRNDDEIHKVAEKLHRMIQIKNQDSMGSTVSPFSVASSSPSFLCTSNPSQAPEEVLTVPVSPEISAVHYVFDDAIDMLAKDPMKSAHVPESHGSSL